MSEDHGVFGLAKRENAALNIVASHIPPNEDWDALEEIRWLLVELVQRRSRKVHDVGAWWPSGPRL